MVYTYLVVLRYKVHELFFGARARGGNERILGQGGGGIIWARAS